MALDVGSRLIAALDVPDRASALALVERIGDATDWFKVGLELFVAEGPDLVRELCRGERRVMLDLKLHDIPATVERATGRAAQLGASLLTVHAGGGRAMMEAAVRGARAGGDLKILAVTVLTSLDDRDVAEVGMSSAVSELVIQRAELAAEAGCDGVVASPQEAARIRERVPSEFLIVTPGVRPAGAAVGDQKRVATPAAARAAGADLVVVGRPIRDADDPAAVARAIAGELRGAGRDS